MTALHSRQTAQLIPRLILLLILSQCVFCFAEDQANGQQSPETPNTQIPSEFDDTLDELPELPEVRVQGERQGEGSNVASGSSAESQLPQSQTGNPDPTPLENAPSNVVVSANQTAAYRTQVGSSVTVIDRAQIESTGQRTVMEVLRSVPGLNIAQAGGPGRQSSIFLRGSNSNHVKVLLDGIPLNDPSTPARAYDFSSLTVDGIQRIEVLKGAQSTIYGSDAIGGVINIITDRGDGPMTVTSRTLGGRYGTFDQSAAVRGGTDTFHYSINGSYFDTEGFSSAAFPPGNSEPDGFHNGVVGGNVGTAVTDNLDADVTFRYGKSSTQTDGFGFVPEIGFVPQDDNTSYAAESFYTRGQLTWRTLDDLVVHRFGYNYGTTNRDAYGVFGNSYNGRNEKFDWQATLDMVDSGLVSHQMTVGTNFVRERAENIYVPWTQLTDSAVFVEQNVGLFERWFTTFGLRYDDYSQAGSATTYRVTSRYNFWSTGTALHGAIGTGFRAPAIEELYNNIFGGNPLLQPEKSLGWEYGVEQIFDDGRLILDATYFRNDFTNLVQFVFDGIPPAFGTLQNTFQAKSHGVELSANYQATDNARLYASYTRTDTRDESTGQLLLRRPQDMITAGISRPILNDKGSLSLSGVYIGKRIDTGDITLSDYVLVNLYAKYQLSPRTQLISRIDNLLDQTYQEIYGYQTSRLAMYGGVQITLGGKAN